VAAVNAREAVVATSKCKRSAQAKRAVGVRMEAREGRDRQGSVHDSHLQSSTPTPL